MTTFDDRESQFEAEFAHDAALQFKVHARRDKLVGLWAAKILGLEGAQAEAFAKEVVIADLEEPGDEDVFRKLRGALNEAPRPVSDEEIRTQMADLMGEAKRQIREAIE